MANNKTVRLNDLRPNDVFYVTGTVLYSNISRMLEGKALEKNIEMQKQRGSKFPTTRPHTYITIENARVWMKDPNNPTKAEIYAQESIYQVTNRETGETSWRFDAKNTGKFLPHILQRHSDDPNVCDEIKLEKEPARGLNVTVAVVVFGGQINNGARLDTVIINEPVRYYQNDVASQLEKMGITVNRMPAQDGILSAPAEEEPMDDTQAPVTPAQGDPFSYGSQSAAPAQNPAAPIGAPVGMVANPAVQNPQATMPAPAGAPAPAAQPMGPVSANPFADPYAVPDNSGNPGGLVYTPNA